MGITIGPDVEITVVCTAGSHLAVIGAPCAFEQYFQGAFGISIGPVVDMTALFEFR